MQDASSRAPRRIIRLPITIVRLPIGYRTPEECYDQWASVLHYKLNIRPQVGTLRHFCQPRNATLTGLTRVAPTGHFSVLERLTPTALRANERKTPPGQHTNSWRGVQGRIALPRPRLNSLPSQRGLTVTRITLADAFELDDCTLLHAVTGRGAADTPGSSTQLTTAAVHTHAATNAPDQR